MYTKEDIDKLKDSVLPIEVIGDLGDDEKKIKLFDILSSYQSKMFVVFKALPGNEKVQKETYKLEQVVENLGLVYAIMPLSGQIFDDIIDDVIQ